jgi:hypothetical protein
MTPRKLLNSSEVGKLLGPPGRPLSRRAITQRLARPYPTIPIPDFVVDVPGHGDVAGWLPDRTDLVPLKPAIDDPALLGDNPDLLPDSFLIGPKQWAHLTGWWGPQYVIQQRSEALRRRALGTSLAGDIPQEDEMRGNSPRWAMGTYRAWRKAVQEARGEDISEEK